jgi:hypothetical protein
MFDYKKAKKVYFRLIASENTEPASSDKRIVFSFKRFTRFFIGTITLLGIGHVIAMYFNLTITNKPPHIKALVNFLHMSSERGIATLFSGLLLLSAALILAFISKAIDNEKGNKRKSYWSKLSFIFLFLCLDETFMIHDRLTPLMHSLVSSGLNGFLYWAWVIPYTFLVLFVGIYFLKFVLALPGKTRALFIKSGTVYVFGALGIEFFEGYAFVNKFHLLDQSLVLIEETMEMAGIAMFIYALIDYIQSRAPQITIVANKKENSIEQ